MIRLRDASFDSTNARFDAAYGLADTAAAAARATQGMASVLMMGSRVKDTHQSHR
jgi:hypothetical protein